MNWSKLAANFMYLLLAIRLDLANSAVSEPDLFPHQVSDGNARFYFADDDFMEVRFTLPFHFFNKTYASVFLSGNGQISFGEGVNAFTPQCSSSPVPMIMAFWADADNRNDRDGCQLLYKETTNRALLQKASKDVFAAFPQLQGITLSWMFIVTWKNVPFFGADSKCLGIFKRNTYQLILTTDGIHSFALIYYNKIMWTTGTSSLGDCRGTGGKPAKAGFDYGDGSTLYTIPGSCTNLIMNITKTSNINQPGKWVFRIDSNLDTASCEKFDETKQKLKLQPPVVSIMGNTPILVHGPCLEKDANVTCVFRDLSRPHPMETIGGVLPYKSVTICPVPYLYSLGRIRLDLRVSYPNQVVPTVYKGYLYVIKEQEIQSMLQVSVNEDKNGSLVMSAKWDPKSLQMEEIEKLDCDNPAMRKDNKPEILHKPFDTVDINVVEYNGKKWREVGTLCSSVDNNGFYQGPFNNTLLYQMVTSKQTKAPPRAFTVKGKRTLGSGVTLEKQHTSSIFEGTEILGQRLRKNILAKTGVKEANNTFDILCKQWYDDEPAPPFDALPCPRTIDQVIIDSRFTTEKGVNLQEFNPGAEQSFIQSTPSRSGAGSQCTYDKEGRLIIGHPSGGRLHRRSPNNWMDNWGHFWEDVVPFLYCCKWSIDKKRNCRKYFYGKRPSDDGSRYSPPRPTRATGDPHITTFDGLSYTFNGVGEFWMVNYTDLENNLTFQMQARMEQYVTVEGKLTNASVFTAAVMEESKNGSHIKVQVFYNSGQIFAMVNDELLDVYERDVNEDKNRNNETIDIKGNEWNFQDGLNLYLGGATIFIKSAEELLVSFSSGFSFTFTTSGPNEVSLNIIGLAGFHLKGKNTAGLLADFDGNLENDLKIPNGTTLLSNSSMEDIHYKFGMHWIVAENQTIFSYPPGKSYLDYYRPDFQPKFITRADFLNLSTESVEFRSGNVECIFDYVTTGSESIANATKEVEIRFEEVVDVVINEVKQCDPIMTPTNGYLVGNSYLVGSSIEVRCEDGYIMYHPTGYNDVNFICVDQASDEISHSNSAQWLGLISRVTIPTPLCLTDPELDEIYKQHVILVGLSVLILLFIGALAVLICYKCFSGQVGLCLYKIKSLAQ